MINNQGTLKQQLKKVLNNINKKYTTLRKELVKVIQVFENNHIPIFPYQVLFGLFKILSETDSVRSIIAFFPFFNQVVTLGFANQQMSKQILALLIHLRSLPKFQSPENQNKLQHLLIQLISKQSISISSIQFSHNMINILSSLKNSTNKALWQKQANAISQISQYLIQSCELSEQQGKEKILATFFKDLVLLGKKQSPNWYRQAIDPFIAYFSIIEIFDSKFILSQRQQWKQCFLTLVPFIRKTIVQTSETSQPTVSMNHIKNWQLSPQHKLILMFKVICKYSTIFHEGFEILEEIIKLITEKSHLHWKLIAYQCISYIFSESRWMQQLLVSNFAQLFNFLLTTQFNTLKAILHDHKQKIDLIGNQLQFPKIFNNVLPDFNIMDFPYNSQIKIILRNMEEISNSLYGIYTDVLKIPLHKKYQQDPPLFKTYKFCQKTVFEIIKAVFSREMNEEILQGILKIAEKFINISGCFGDYSVTIMYMKLLCKYCLPSEFKLIGKRHVQINKMILSTVNCLGGLLNTACWVIVWKALENYSLYYNKYLLSKEHHQPQRQSDVQILFKTMDSIFTQTPKYSDQYLLNIINSLIQVTYECLENNYSDDSRKIFSFQRIQQVYKLNLFRIPLMWPSLSSSLLCITTSKIAYFRISALNLLNTLIPMSLYHLSNHPQHFTQKFNAENYQTLILQPWVSLVKCPFQEIKNQMVVALNKIIIDYGHILSHGWLSILQVVSNMRDLKSLQSIVQTFLDKVDNKIMDILLTIDFIERQLHDTNQKYLCLTLIWAIGDYSHKHNHPKVLRKIYSILLQPDQMFSLGTEARHSSFYIFAQLIVHNCLENSNQFWSEVFEGIQNFCTFGVNKSIESKDKKLAEDAIKNILVNMIKIYRIFFMVSQQWQVKSLVQKKLQYFYTLCANILKFRQTQVYQALIKQMKQILFAKTQQSLKLYELVLFIEALTQAYIVEKQTKILKCLITYLPMDLYEIILKCTPISPHNFGTLYKLIEKIFLIRLQAQEKDIKLAQARIFFQQKQFNQFYKKFHSSIVENYQDIVPQYMEKFVKTLHHLFLYEDYTYLSKMFQYGTSVILSFEAISPDGITDLLCKITFVKFDSQWSNKFGQSKQVPIWYISSQQLIKLSYQFMNRKKYEKCIRIYQTFIKSLLNNQSELLLRTGTSVQCASFYYQNEIAIANFIIDNFFYNQVFKNQDVNQDFIKILQKIIECSKGFNEKDPKNWSKNFYELLFKISQKKSENQQNQFVQQRQITVIKALLSRINETFDCFTKSQLKQSSQNSSITTETKFVLKKINTLECQEGIFAKYDLQKFITENYKLKIKSTNFLTKHSKFHLFILNQWLIQCIKCKNQEVRALVADIYEQKNNVLVQYQ